MRRYLWNILISIDQLGNAVAFGDPDETISSRLGKWKRNRMREDRWPPSRFHPLYWLERVLDWIDPDHVLNAIEGDEGEHEIKWHMNRTR